MRLFIRSCWPLEKFRIQYLDLRSPDSKPGLGVDEEPEDQLAILEELERQEIELKEEAARKIQVRLPTLNGHFALKIMSQFKGDKGPN